MTDWQREFDQCCKDRDEWKARAEKAEAFKAFVHRRLNIARVPADPHPAETLKTGCRIGGRLNLVLTSWKP